LTEQAEVEGIEMSNNTNRRPQPTIEFWFEFGSNYSYLSAMRIEAAAAQIGVAVHWRPFLLGPIFQSLGWSSSPFVLQQAKGVYVWKDMQRQCAKYGIPWRMPTVFPRPATLPMKVAAAFAGEPWIGSYCRAFMTKNFALDKDTSPTARCSGATIDSTTRWRSRLRRRDA
jgi:2-hydroxychromene-2-carboxylate isomerase